MDERTLRGVVAGLSALVFAFLSWLLYGRAPGGEAAGAATSVLPVFNAAMNTSSALALVAGYRAIRGGDRRRHAAFMLVAVAASALFLAGYVAHHAAVGDTPFRGTGPVRAFYLAVLASHVLVTVAALPMILMTLAQAGLGRFDSHKAVARRTLPLWLYVSVTGVLVFAMLRWWG